MDSDWLSFYSRIGEIWTLVYLRISGLYHHWMGNAINTDADLGNDVAYES